MVEPIRWGILGTGNIASRFAEALAGMPDAELVAVGSRTGASALRFGERYGVPIRYASYEGLARDPDVEVIYVATPHPLHHANTLLCLEAGKSVLCEKPFAMNAREAAEMIALARERDRFLMEAMWTRFLPVMERVGALLAQGAIGEVRAVQASFGFRAPFDPGGRLWNRELGGGSLLDVGVYPVHLAVLLLGLPDSVQSQAHLGRTGVDEQAGIVFGYEGGRMALLSSSLQVALPNEAHILGTEGRIRIPARWHDAQRLLLTREGEAEQTIEAPIQGSGYAYEAAEVHRCLRAGVTESPLMPLDETLAILRLLDAIRTEWGLHYPADDAPDSTGQEELDHS